MQRLGKYELRGEIGRGAAGVVYEGWDPRLERRVAIKVVQVTDPTQRDTAEIRARFRQEAQFAGRLTHPGIVGIYEYDETLNHAYIVMEFVDGETLKAVLDRKEPIGLDRSLDIVRQMLLALGDCHRHGIVHRDLKPSNLMLSRDGRVKLTDFGVARTSASDLTLHGTLIGTPAYMSPEQFSSERPADARSDIYASAVICYELLTGSRPFEGDVTAIMLQVLTAVPAPPSQKSPSLPLALDAVVLQAMARQPDERFATAEAFAAALQVAMRSDGGVSESDATIAGISLTDATVVGMAPPVPQLPVAPVPPARTPTPVTSTPPRVGLPTPSPSTSLRSTPTDGSTASWYHARSRQIVVGGIGGTALLATAAVIWFLSNPAPSLRQAPQPAALPSSTPTLPAPTSPAPARPALMPPAPTQLTPTPTAPIQSMPAQPAPTPPVQTRPAPVPPVPAPSTPTQPAPASPGRIPPAPMQPTPTQPALTQSVPSSTAPTSSTPTLSTPIQPSPTQPALTPSVPTSPAPTSPAPTLPTPMQTAPTQPALTPSTPTLPTPTPPAPTLSTPIQPRPSEPVPLPLQQADLATSLATLTCSTVTAKLQSSPEQLVVSGLIGTGTARTTLDAITNRFPTPGVQDTVMTFPASTLFCRAADLARSAMMEQRGEQSGAALRLTLHNGRTRLVTDDPITLTIRMPDFDGELRVDYLTNGGTTIVHVEPAGGMAQQYRANAEVRLGPEHDGTIGSASEPYGTDMIMAVAASRPLLAPRPSQEDADTYFGRLQAAIDTVRRQGGKVSVGLVALETVAK